MSEPTSAYTLRDLLRRVAIAAKVAYYGTAGSSRATIPVDEYNFDTCLRCVNGGIKSFIANAPQPSGWRWMNHIAEITFGIVETTGTVDNGSSTCLADSSLRTTYATNDLINNYYIYDLTQEIYAKVTDYELRNGTAVCTDGTDKILVTSEAHGLVTGDVVTIAGTSSYDGSHAITYVSDDTFTFVDTYDAEETGTWTQTQVTVAAWLDYNDNPSSLTPAADDSYSITDVKTVHGDKTRYYLPDDFHGEITGPITYAADTGRGHIEWRHEGELRKRREISKNTGYPMIAAIRRSPARRKWELIVSPSPTATDTVVFPYKTGFDDLQAVIGITTASAADSVTIDGLKDEYPNDYFNGWYAYCVAGTGRNSYAKITDFTSVDGKLTVTKWLALDGVTTGTTPHATAAYMFICDNYKHPAGIQFDNAVLSACLACAEFEFEEVSSPIPGLSNNEKFYKIDLPAARLQDARSAPKRLGPMMPASGRPGPTRTWKNPVRGYYTDGVFYAL